ncbi:MAG: ATP-binding protein [Paracoccaceae bacterium]|nr:ATP-binding protein [Paracoccaceae bacterium]
MTMPDSAEGKAHPGAIHCWLPGDAFAVRATLAQLLPRLAELIPCEDDLGAAEIVLAEVLNNIVEHAYRGRRGDIEVDLTITPEGVRFVVTDSGDPFPDRRLPSGRLVAGRLTDSLSEGGFGWHLIRNLSRELHYERNRGQNRLSFLLPADQSRKRGEIGRS